MHDSLHELEAAEQPHFGIRGGTRATRPRVREGCMALCLVNIGSLVKRWQSVMDSEAQLLVLVETRATDSEQAWIQKAGTSMGWSFVWSDPVVSDSRRIGGGMVGRSGGALILAGNGWVARPMKMPLSLEAPKVHWSYARVESRSTGEVVRCLAYYGHPLDRARTLRDMHVVDELETTDTAPLVVMGDLNIDDTYHEMHLTRLGDAGLRWAFQKGTDPEPTFVNNGVSARIDRVWVSYSLLQSLLLFSVEDTFLVPGHRAVWTYYEARSDAIWTSHAAPAIDVQGIQKDPLWERALGEMWNVYVSQPRSVADMYIRWSTMWEQYLREVTNTPGELVRHKPAKPVQDRVGGVSQNLSHAIRRLQNFVAKIRKLRGLALKGVHNSSLWHTVKTSSAYFAAKYGAPVLDLQQMDEPTCIAQVLKT